MSTNSRSSWSARRSLNRQSGLHGDRRSFAAPKDVNFEDGYSFALRVAFLDYILQPRKKRKEYVQAPKPATRSHTSSFHSNMMDITKSSSSTKLPHNFQKHIEKRIEGVMVGVEKMAGYNDAALKRSFAEAYTALTASDVRKSLDKDRNIELYLLKFFSAATKAQQRGKAPDDDSWKMLPDRHVAMFLRLVQSVIRELGGDSKRQEMMKGLATLEKKILTNDQDLSLDTSGQEGQHKFIEVEIPLSYNVQDMHMVQIVSKVFGRSQSEVQGDIDSHMAFWTEEAAMKDLKAYQNRLASNTTGAPRRQDFEADAAYEEWKKAETVQLGQLMHEVLTVRPELAKLTTGAHEKPLPTRPKSTYDESYGDLSRAIMAGGPDPNFGFDPSGSMGSMSIEDSPGIRQVPDDSDYVYIPPYPRAYYKFVLKTALSYDSLNPDVPDEPVLSKQSNELLTELAVQWRIPQFSRHIIYLEVAAQKYLDLEISTTDLYTIFDIVKETKPPEPKKPPLIQLHNQALDEIDRQKWTLQDSLTYKQTLDQLHQGLLRELHENASRCYEPKAPSVGPSLMFIMNHIRSDPGFTWADQDADDFSNSLTDSLRIKAEEVYREYLNSNVPPSKEEWDFSHVVNLGKAVTTLCEKIRKRYKKNPEIMGVSPFAVLVAKIFPMFQSDAPYLINSIIDVAKERGLEVNLQDGFDLYKELVAIRKIHDECLREQKFAFNIEELLEEFVWRWIKGAEARMTEFVEEAIKQDNFQPRAQAADGIPTDAERHSHSVIDMFQLFNQTVDQVVQLGWDSDIHHAQFMTSLSKAFTAGVGRYCEVLEQMFSREMDRQTKQELEAAGKSTQERFMQYARDAMSAKEKVEPFQFFPESFIKLNNIEYAMQALDKLEKVVNVDACAEVLMRHEKATKTNQRKIVKNVFTIKIVEAEDIKACDPTGLSDPYVVLCDEYQKRLAKTRIIMKSLNPRWDESVDIAVSGPLNIIATLWDYDTFGDHDFVGRTSLKLDPLHFSDYLPREYWLDLDTQGRLLLRVSMEGERDDIQFHFGKAFRHLKRTERDMVRKISDKLNTHINASLSRDALRSLLSRGIASSVAVLWQKRTSKPPALTQEDIVNALQSLFTYFDENFAIMKQTLTDATMVAVMTRLWKEVLMAVEHLLVPPLSEKPSLQKPLTQAELDVVYRWLQLLFDFFNAKDDQGEVLGVPADVLKSPKWHELASLNFFYFDTTDNLIRTSERIVAANTQRAQQQMQQSSQGNNRLSAPPALGASLAPPGSLFASMGTIRRGKSVMMSRNLGTMRRMKEEKRKEAQADPSDDMILRILRMRPEAANYLKERHRQKERMAAHQAAALIVKQSVNQGWNQPAPLFGGGQFGRNNLPRR